MVRADREIDASILRKLSLMCGIPEHCVIPSATVKSIYQVPVNYQSHALGNTLLQQLQLPQKPFAMEPWKQLLEHIEQATCVKKVAMVGKYCALEDAYYSLNEGLKVAGYWGGVRIQLSFIDAEEIEKAGGASCLQGFDGICVP